MTRRAVIAMVRRSTWKNDILELTLLSRVVVRRTVDASGFNRSISLLEHLDYIIYKENQIHQYNNVGLTAENDTSNRILPINIRECIKQEDLNTNGVNK